MGSVWDLAVPLLFFCWKAGVAASSAGLSISSSAPVVTTSNTEVPASTQRDRPSSAGAFQTTALTQYVPLDAQTLSAKTASNTLAATSTSSEVSSGNTQISPVTETGKTQTTCPAASALDIQITSTTASALETQTSSLAAFSIDTQATSPAASSLDTQTTSAASSLDTQTTSAASTLDTQTTSAASTLDTQTTSAASTLDTQTTSATSSLNTQTTSAASSLDTQTTSAASSLDTQTTSAASSLDTQTTSVASLDTQTTSAASTLDTQTSSPAASLDTQTTSATSSLDTQTTSATSSLDTQTTSAASSLDTQTTSAASTLDTQTTFFDALSLDTQTTSPAISTMGTQTTFLDALSLNTQTTSPAASTLDIQTTSAASSLDTQTIFPTTGTLENQTIFPVELTIKTQTISPVTETRTLAIRVPSNFTVVYPNPTDTSATSGSPKIEMSTVKTGTVSDPIEAIFDTLCTDDSSEEARKITVDLLTLAHTSTEAEHLSSESGSSLDNSVRVLTSPQVLGPDTAPPAKDLVAFSITHIKLTTCITEIETPAIIPGTSDTNHNPTRALFTSETLTSPQSPEANPLSPKTPSSFGTLPITGTSALAITLEGTLPTSDITERETTAAQTLTSGGTLVTVSRNPLKDTSALFIETQSHTEALGTITVPGAAGSTMAETKSFSGSTSDSSPSAGATTRGSTTSETSATADRTSSSFLAGSSPLPFVYATTASASKNPNITLAKTTASPKTPGMPSPSTPTTSWTRRTPKHDPGKDGGFLLVRVSVASPEDLTEPKAAEKLMHQLNCELHTHMPLIQVSVLSVRRG